MRDCPHVRTSRAAGRRAPGVRGLAEGRLRVVLPQRDRSPARRAGRHAGRRAGRVWWRRPRGAATLYAFGTGGGVGTAWLRSGVRDGLRIVTAELDPKLAKAAAEIFEDDPQVEVVAADWSTLFDKGPFSLLFLDSGKPSAVGPEKVWDLVEEGGIVVLDDFTPCEHWPPTYAGRVDTLREEWLSDERF